MKKKNFFAQYKQFTFFLILAVVIILIAVFAPVVSGGVDPLKGSLDEALLAPSKAHIFGTDKMGRDIFARVIYGARASLTATFGVVALIFFIGTTLGVIAGYFGGIVDSVIMRIADMMLSFPGLVLALAVAGIMGASMKNAIVAVVVVNWTKYARLGRSLVLKIRHCDYVEAAIVTGSKTPYMILRYRWHDVGTGSYVLPGIRSKTSGTGMGLYVKRRKSMYSVCTMDDDFPRSGNFCCSCSL